MLASLPIVDLSLSLSLRKQVGVTFDDPVGTGTGRYEGEQLFQAPLGHGSLIPVGGLLRADDYSDSLPPSRTDNRVDVVVGRRARKAQANPSAIAGYSRQLSSLGEQQQNNASTPERRNIAEPQTPHNSVICKPKRDCFGRYRGIQGRNNSCYLDATLFSLFQFTSVFDPLLYRPRRGSDIPEYERVQVRPKLRRDSRGREGEHMCSICDTVFAPPTIEALNLRAHAKIRKF